MTLSIESVIVVVFVMPPPDPVMVSVCVSWGMSSLVVMSSIEEYGGSPWLGLNVGVASSGTSDMDSVTVEDVPDMRRIANEKVAVSPVFIVWEVCTAIMLKSNGGG